VPSVERFPTFLIKVSLKITMGLELEALASDATRYIHLTMMNKIALQFVGCWINHFRQTDLLPAKALEFELGQLGFKIKNIEEFISTTPKKSLQQP
jgi:hypothetical protein